MNKKLFTLLSVSSLLILLLTACSNNGNPTSIVDGSALPSAKTLIEYEITPITLPKEQSEASMEYSGLAWYGNNLILLPQYPEGIDGNRDGFLYAISRESLIDFLENPATQVQIGSIPFDDAGLSKDIIGFEGFEAVVFVEDSVYLTIEARGGNPMKSYLVKGTVVTEEGRISKILLDASSLVELKVQNTSSNASYEALTTDGQYIYAFFEQNGKAQNDHPYAVRLNLDLTNYQEVPLDFINYRLTDATIMNDDGGFWIINYFFPGDTHLRVGEDPISTRYGLGESHQQNEPVERLVKMNFTNGEFVLAEEAPLYLHLLENNEARNWEGLVELDDSGFLIVTDKFPGSILVYIKIK